MYNTENINVNLTDNESKFLLFFLIAPKLLMLL